jgi:hypothetical protein
MTASHSLLVPVIASQADVCDRLSKLYHNRGCGADPQGNIRCWRKQANFFFRINGLA